MMTAEAVAVSATGNGGRLVAADGRELPLAGVRLEASAKGGLVRAVLSQRFRNPHAEPLRVHYLFPLPHDAAVSGFAFTVGDRRVVGEIDRRAAARERFEEALATGRTAAIVDQERGSVFTQELGNVPPGAEVVAELTVDQRLAWRPDGAWEWRFPTALAPRYQGGPGRVLDAGALTVDVADAALAPRLALALRVEDALAEGGAPESPSHALLVRTEAGGQRIALAADGCVRLDRDLVIRWPAAAGAVGLTLGTFRAAAGPLAADAYGLLTLVPPAPRAAQARFGRDLVVLLDTSGSMSGEPLAQAVRVVSALVETLDEGDTLELVEFSDAPRRWRPQPVRASAAERRAALAWLARLRAGGSTEMADAIREALAGLRPGAQRQLLLVTDGHIGFEQEIVAELQRGLPAGTRLHTLGVGSSVNRSLLGPAARAGRGTESIVGLGEDVERAVQVLVARTAAPLVTNLAVSGPALIAHAPARLPDLFGGAPALLPLWLRPEGGTLRVTGELPDGAFERTVEVPPVAPGSGAPALAALFGREALEDLEARLAAGEDQEAIDGELERLALAHQLSSRLTSWIAVTEEPSVDPTQPARRVRMPQELPYGMSVEGLGLRAAGAGLVAGGVLVLQEAMLDAAPSLVARAAAPSPSRPRAGGISGLQRKRMLRGALEPSSGRRVLRARVARLGGSLYAVEAELDAPLDWTLPRFVQVVSGARGGEVQEASVAPGRSTASGALAAGVVLRLTLRCPHGAPDDRIVIELPGGDVLVLELETRPA